MNPIISRTSGTQVVAAAHALALRAAPVIAALIVAGVTVAGEIQLERSRVGGGGVTASTSGPLTLTGTVGQADASRSMTSGAFQLRGGFLSGIGRIAGDGDNDGDVDLDDHKAFIECALQPGSSVAAGCDVYDIDSNGRIDLIDWALFQALFTG